MLKFWFNFSSILSIIPYILHRLVFLLDYSWCYSNIAFIVKKKKKRIKELKRKKGNKSNNHFSFCCDNSILGMNFIAKRIDLSLFAASNLIYHEKVRARYDFFNLSTNDNSIFHGEVGASKRTIYQKTARKEIGHDRKSQSRPPVYYNTS